MFHQYTSPVWVLPKDLEFLAEGYCLLRNHLFIRFDELTTSLRGTERLLNVVRLPVRADRVDVSQSSCSADCSLGMHRVGICSGN